MNLWPFRKRAKPDCAAIAAEIDASLAQRKVVRVAHQAAGKLGYSTNIKRRGEQARRILGDFA